MAVRGSGRFIAPLALIASVLGVMVVVLISRVDAPAPAVTPQQATQTDTQREKPKRRFYVVKPGDNLTVISEKTGISIETIERLNPDVDPQTLAAGARLKLTP